MERSAEFFKDGARIVFASGFLLATSCLAPGLLQHASSSSTASAGPAQSTSRLPATSSSVPTSDNDLGYDLDGSEGTAPTSPAYESDARSAFIVQHAGSVEDYQQYRKSWENQLSRLEEIGCLDVVNSALRGPTDVIVENIRGADWAAEAFAMVKSRRSPHSVAAEVELGSATEERDDETTLTLLERRVEEKTQGLERAATELSRAHHTLLAFRRSRSGVSEEYSEDIEAENADNDEDKNANDAEDEDEYECAEHQRDHYNIAMPTAAQETSPEPSEQDEAAQEAEDDADARDRAFLELFAMMEAQSSPHPSSEDRKPDPDERDQSEEDWLQTQEEKLPSPHWSAGPILPKRLFGDLLECERNTIGPHWLPTYGPSPIKFEPVVPEKIGFPDTKKSDNIKVKKRQKNADALKKGTAKSRPLKVRRDEKGKGKAKEEPEECSARKKLVFESHPLFMGPRISDEASGMVAGREKHALSRKEGPSRPIFDGRKKRNRQSEEGTEASRIQRRRLK